MSEPSWTPPSVRYELTPRRVCLGCGSPYRTELVCLPDGSATLTDLCAPCRTAAARLPACPLPR